MVFEKVSFTTFRKDLERCGIATTKYFAEQSYKNIKLPERKTAYSCGYDIFTPIPLVIRGGTTLVVPTGIKCRFSPTEASSMYLSLFVRSSIGIKRGVVLANGTGVIDGDYYDNPDNEGDIHMALYARHDVQFDPGERIMQGVFHAYFTADNCNGSAIRVGGIGSTGK